MAKRVTKGFASKTEKALLDKHKICPVCGGDIVRLKHVQTVSEENTIRFNEKMVKVCKCNQSEIYK
jgi:hypothetical protein